MSFPLVGNESVRASVEGILASRRLPHAILIEGDKGFGRSTLAHYIATAAVCRGDKIPCFECRDCHLAKVGSHPDIAYVTAEEGKKNITVAKIRELRAEAYVKAHSASYRVFIVEDAEKMNEQAQNSLLKVLEEPPQGVVFILMALSRTAMLETIVSRCTVLTLSAPPKAEAQDYILKSGSFDKNAVIDALEAADNNIGRALSLLKNNQDDKVSIAAKQFFELIFSGSELEMLKLTIPLEKDRNGADAFFAKLKAIVSNELKNDYKRVRKAKALNEIYSYLTECEERLKTNINLPLMFSAAVCKCKDIVNN